MTRLRQETLAEIGGRVPVPGYDRAAVTTGIVHIGVGGFHRSHLAAYVDRLLTEQPEAAAGWGITGVGLLDVDAAMRDVLAAQDGLYSLLVKHPDGTLDARVIGSLVRYLFAPDDPEAVLAALADPATRIVSMTITEGGYHVNQTTGEFDPDTPDLKADLVGDGPPRTAFGFLAEGLRRRRDAGVAPFTVMSCDNIPGNGEVARRTLTAFAALRDPALGAWIADEVCFPDAMVDRITPVTTAEDRALLSERFGIEDGWPVVAEPFTQWVLQDRFGTDGDRPGRPDFGAVGAELVDDVHPFEQMKLRLLNASHQALCYLGWLDGYRFAHEVCQDPLYAEFLLGYMVEEAQPTLPPLPGVDLDRYEHQLVERFANPGIRDSLARLCAESSDRIPKWLVPVVNDQLARGGPVDRAALVVASWARYAEGTDEQGRPIDVVDTRREQVMARAREQDADPLAFLRAPDLFGGLVDEPAFTQPYAAALASLRSVGARRTLEAWVARTRRGPAQEPWT